MTKPMKALAFAALMSLAGVASSTPVVLTFEGLGDLASVNNFYNGGTDSQGHVGTNYGITFSNALGVQDSDAGGSGSLANEPSASTVLLFGGPSNVLNDAAGFTNGFSFFYSSGTAHATINIYDGLNGTGNLLATFNLAEQYNNNCTGDPAGEFCNWTSIGISFSSTAKSVDFGSAVTGSVIFDDITLGSATAGDTGASSVPEPASMALVGVALAGALAVGRRRAKR